MSCCKQVDLNYLLSARTTWAKLSDTREDSRLCGNCGMGFLYYYGAAGKLTSFVVFHERLLSGSPMAQTYVMW